MSQTDTEARVPTQKAGPIEAGSKAAPKGWSYVGLGEYLDGFVDLLDGHAEFAPRVIEAFTALFERRNVPNSTLSNAYTIYPFAGPTGNWVDLCRQLTAQHEKVVVNFHIEPTRLHDHEKDAIEQAKSLTRDLSDFRYQGLGGNYEFRDPNAELLFKVYSTLGIRLARPFLAVVQVAAESVATARNIAAFVGSKLASRPPKTLEDQADELPLEFALFECKPADAKQALTTYQHLRLTPWGETLATPEKARFSFLMDARGAAALFRFPVPTETGLPGIEVRKLKAGYEQGFRTSAVPDRHIHIGTEKNGSLVTIPVDHLTRHALIAGMPGSGKSNLTIGLLRQLWADHRVPFWVFEPPKTEYRGFLEQPGFEDLLVFTVGDESTTPFRLNPFELLEGITVEQHINNLKVCFEAGLPRMGNDNGLLVMLLDRAIRDIYKQHGWRSWDRRDAGLPFPTMYDLLVSAKKAVGIYAGEIKQNLEAAVGNRIETLLRGSKGRMFNTRQSVPLATLLNRPVVFELMPMGADAPLALMFILTFLMEHAQQRQDTRGLVHLTVIEEAHVIMSRAAGPDRAADSAVGDAFERMLAELRSSGEGVIIAEQSPTKLIKGAIDLTNLKIAHRLAGPEEVEAVGGAMIATQSQMKTFQNLRIGEAAVHREGLEGLLFMNAPDHKGQMHFKDRLPRDRVAEHMQPFYDRYPTLRLPFNGCLFCESQCRYRATVAPMVAEGGEEFARLTVQKNGGNKVRPEEAAKSYYRYLIERARQAGFTGQKDVAWCFRAQSEDEDYVFVASQRREFETWWNRLNDNG